MNWSVLRLLYVHELKMLVRARRTVVMAIVLPAVIMPLMLYAQKYSADRRQRLLTGATYQYAISGTLADRIRSLIDQTRRTIAQSRDADLDRLRQFKFVEVQAATPRTLLDRNEIQFYIEALSPEEADRNPPKEETSGSRTTAVPRRLPGVPVIHVIYRGDSDASDNAHDQMMALLRLARQSDLQALLVEHGFPGDPKQLFAVEDSSLATKGQVTGSLVGRFITLFLVMMMFTGGAVASMDIISGEKERGTLETLLTTAVGRSEIVAAKQLAITSVGLVITLMQGLNFLLYIKLNKK